jgi:hypothetical protein
MTGDWVAVAVRGRGLAGRRLGRAGVRRIAQYSSVAAAVADLSRTAYGRDVRPGMDLRTAQHAVYATLAWHLRILAGWAPIHGADRVRRLAAGFEIANITGRLAHLDGRPAEPAFTLGALAVGWSNVAAARTPAEVRQALTASAWGDPGSEELAAIRMVLAAAWARRVSEHVPEADAWSSAFAALLVARALAAGVFLASDDVTRRHISAVLGLRWTRAATLAELPSLVPRAAAWVLEGVKAPGDLWRAELRWWNRLEVDGLRLCATPRPEPGMVVGLVALLAADAWRTCGALERAARGGHVTAEDFDEVA